MDTPNFAGGPVEARAALSTASPARDGSGGTVQMVAAQTNGIRIDKIRVQAMGGTVEGCVRIFMVKTAGPVRTLVAEVPVAPTAPAATAAAWWCVLDSASDSRLPIVLPPGHELHVASHTADAFQLSAVVGAF